MLVWEITGAILILSALIWIFYVPIYWIRVRWVTFSSSLSLPCVLIDKKFHWKDLSEVGFDGKRSAINRTRRLRKIGTKIPPPFPNGWFVVAESVEVKTGAAKSVNCLGENFIVFRSLKSKEVFVLDAYCPHMGANLGVGGIVVGDCVECPFHQWKFSGVDGACVGIPYSKSLTESKLLKVANLASNVYMQPIKATTQCC